MAKTPITTVDEALGRLREHFSEEMLQNMNARRAQRGARTRVLTCAEMIPHLPERAWTLGQHLEAAELLEKLTASSRQISGWSVTPRHKCQHHREQTLLALDWLCKFLLERIQNEERLDNIRFAELSAKPFDQWTGADDTQFERLTLRVIDDGEGEFRTEETSNPNRLALYLARADYLKQRQQLQEESDPVSNNDPKGPLDLNPNKTVVAGSGGDENNNAPLNPDAERVAQLLSPTKWVEQDFTDAVRIGGFEAPYGGYEAGANNAQLWFRFVAEYELFHNYEPVSAAEASQAKALEAFPLASWERAHVVRARQIAIAKHVRDGGSEVREGLGELNDLANQAEKRLNNLEEAAKLAAKPTDQWTWPHDYNNALTLCATDVNDRPIVVRPGFEAAWRQATAAAHARLADLTSIIDEKRSPKLLAEHTKALHRHLGITNPRQVPAPDENPLPLAAYNRWRALELVNSSIPWTMDEVRWSESSNVLNTLQFHTRAALTEAHDRIVAKSSTPPTPTATNDPAPKAASEPDPRPSDAAKEMAKLVQKPSMRDLLRKWPRYLAVIAASIAGVLLMTHLLSSTKTVTDESILSSVDGGGAVMEPMQPAATEVPTEVQPSEEPSTPPAPPAPAPPTPTTAPVPLTSAHLGGQPLGSVNWTHVEGFFRHVRCTSPMGEVAGGHYDLRNRGCTWTP